MERARYVLAAKLAGRQVGDSGDTQVAMAQALSMFSAVRVIEGARDAAVESRRPVLFEANREEVEERRKDLPEDVILEPEILHRFEIVLPPDWARASQAGPSGSFPSSFEIRATGAGSPIPNAEAYLWTRGPQGVEIHRAKSDMSGSCRFALSPVCTPERLVVAPASRYWTMVEDNPQSGIVVDCRPLPSGALGWWHDLSGIDRYEINRGRGIKVGVIDSGVGPHPSLSHVVGAGAFVNGVVSTGRASYDVGSHGSHVSGIVGARPRGQRDFAGIAPGCELLMARVVDTEDDLFNQRDIANALEELLKHEVDLVNMSFGADQPSDVLLDRIEDALDHGTLCVCAAGNSATGCLKWPAAFRESVGVSAVGRRGSAPPGTLAAMRQPSQQDRWNGDLFLANFSCFGASLDCAAPGVGIISTVPYSSPGSAYRDMCGTSMACPGVVGLVAAVLSEDTAYLKLPRDRSRAEAARRKLERCLVDVGLAPAYQGGGVPHL